jgi:hypothetical protein
VGYALKKAIQFLLLDLKCQFANENRAFLVDFREFLENLPAMWGQGDRKINHELINHQLWSNCSVPINKTDMIAIRRGEKKLAKKKFLRSSSITVAMVT